MIFPSDTKLLRLISESSEALNQKKASIPHFYFMNRDGSARWIYPASLRYPSFLNFYNQSSTRGKLLKLLIKIIFYANLFLRVLVRKHSSEVADGSILAEILSRGDDFNYSIFMGTVGENRKVIVEVNENKNTISFIKVGVSASAVGLVDNECYILRQLSERGSVSFEFPKVLSHARGIVEISNINFDGSLQSPRLLPAHLAAVKELAEMGSSCSKYNELPASEDITKGIEKLENRLGNFESNNGIELSALVGQLRTIVSLMDNDSIMYCGLCHGDFTPWNMYVKDNQLYIYDWEMCTEGVPVFFDIFHFVFQSEILLNQSDYSIIKENIVSFFKEDRTISMVRLFNIDINQSYMFYLLFIVTKYLNLYVVQDVPHQQIYWMVAVWKKAMQDIISTKGKPFR